VGRQSKDVGYGLQVMWLGFCCHFSNCIHLAQIGFTERKIDAGFFAKQLNKFKSMPVIRDCAVGTLYAVN
jgi:hypothetical protein